jgi:hypothetical protein
MILTYLMVTGLVSLFRLFHTLWALLIPNRWGNPLSLFGNPYWYLFGSLYLLNLRILTYPSVAGFIFTFSPFSPSAGPIPHWWVAESIIPLQASLWVFNQFIISIKTHNTNLSYGCRIIFPFSCYTLLRFGSLSLLVTVCITVDSEEK